jgi:predicted membrane protein
MGGLFLLHHSENQLKKTKISMEKHMHFTDEKGRSVAPALKRKTIMFGLLVITFGVFWLLKNFDMLDPVVQRSVFSWQALVIAIGLINLVNGHARFFGAILIVLGTFFLATELYDLPVTFSQAFWPSLIILVGLMVVFGSRRIFRKRVHIVTESDDYFEEVSVFGGRERKVVSSSFKGGKSIAIFGGSELDLTRCELAPGRQEIEFVSIFGGAKLIVPKDWNVKTEVVNIMGGFSDKRSMSEVVEDKVLIIKGVAIFGGGELSN